MAQVVERPIRTHAATDDYRAGHVFTFRRCPECNSKLTTDSEHEHGFHFVCPQCGVTGDVDLKREELSDFTYPQE